MRLLSWLDAGRWSASHISHIGAPLCEAPVPDKPQARLERPAEIQDWPHICPDCRTLSVKGATAPIEETTTVIDLMTAITTSLKATP
jgi:hypothetical protein